MKRTILAIAGLFTLVACSEEVYQDIDKPNSENVETISEDSVGNTPYTVSNTGFHSPYEDTNYGNSILYWLETIRLMF